MRVPGWTDGPLRVMGVLSSRGVALALQLGLMAIVGRSLGVEGLGLYALFVSWLTIVGTLGSFGAPMQNLRDVSVATGAGDGARAQRIFKTNLKAGLIGAMVLASLLAVASPWLSSWFVPAGGPAGFLLLAAGAAVLFAALKTMTEGLKGAGHGQTAIFLESGFAPAILLLGLGAAWIGNVDFGISLLLMGHAGALVLAILVAALVWNRSRTSTGMATQDLPPRNSRLVFGTTSVLGALAGNLAIVVIPLFLDTQAIGLFAAAKKLVNVAAIILATLSAYFAPRFAQGYARQDASGLARELWLSQAYSITLYMPLFLAFVLVPGLVLSLFGSGFAAATTLLVILAVGQLLNSATGLVGYFLNMVHRERAELQSMILAIAMYVVALVALAPTQGVQGVAYATAGFMVTKNLLALGWCLTSIRGFQGEWQEPRPEACA